MQENFGEPIRFSLALNDVSEVISGLDVVFRRSVIYGWKECKGYHSILLVASVCHQWCLPSMDSNAIHS